MNSAFSARGDRGVISDDHPAVKIGVTLSSASATYKAGTILKASTSNGTFEPAATADTPAGVLIEDAEHGKDNGGIVKMLVHGVVVSKRLLDNTGNEAADALKAKLPAIAIWISQAWKGDTE